MLVNVRSAVKPRRPDWRPAVALASVPGLYRTIQRLVGSAESVVSPGAAGAAEAGGGSVAGAGGSVGPGSPSTAGSAVAAGSTLAEGVTAGVGSGDDVESTIGAMEGSAVGVVGSAAAAGPAI